PIVEKIRSKPRLPGIGQGQTFRGIRLARNAKQKRGKGVPGNIAVEIQIATSNVRRTAKERDTSDINACLEIMRPSIDGHIVAPLPLLVEVESIATVDIS